MIEQATERRLTGDWRGACAVAGVHVAFDLGQIAEVHGRKVAAGVEADVRRLAPDLMLWHFPRLLRGHTTLHTNRVVLLARYDGAAEHWLHVVPPRLPYGPQRPILRFGRIPEKQGTFDVELDDWSRARHLWDESRSHELLARCGGSTRAPFFHADGRPLAESELPSGPSRDAAAHTEWVTALFERGEIEAAFAAAGIELRPGDRRRIHTPRLSDLAWFPLVLTRVADEVRITGHRRIHHVRRWPILLDIEVRGTEVTAQVVDSLYRHDPPRSFLAEACWRRLPDLDLIRIGRLDPGHLHPLVHAALFPAATTPAVGPPEPAEPAMVRVRCRGGAWHEVGPGPSIPHDDAERRRERVMKALGGTLTGCFAAEEAWLTGTGRLPRALREQRRDLFTRMRHGDLPGVLRLLDAGLDPRVRDGRGRTLLHLLHLLKPVRPTGDVESLLPRLLRAGLDLQTKDLDGRTPLMVAVAEHGSTTLIKAMLTAGAWTDVTDNHGRSLRDLAGRSKHPDLDFLRKLFDSVP
jgi:hypothetical protein